MLNIYRNNRKNIFLNKSLKNNLKNVTQLLNIENIKFLIHQQTSNSIKMSLEIEKKKNSIQVLTK